jgi:hypothetical protein
MTTVFIVRGSPAGGLDPGQYLINAACGNIFDCIDANRAKDAFSAEHVTILHTIAGIVRTAMSDLPARAAGRDLAVRRRVEAVVNETLQEIADEARRRAAERGRPTSATKVATNDADELSTSSSGYASLGPRH